MVCYPFFFCTRLGDFLYARSKSCPITIAIFRPTTTNYIGFQYMSSTLENNIMRALSAVLYDGVDIVARGMVDGLQITGGKDVFFVLEVEPSMGGQMEILRQEAEKAVRSVHGVGRVDIVLTAERSAGPALSQGPDPHGMNKNPPLTLPIRHIVAVGSGKGGVGKSTVAFNLAVALSRMGLSVGLLDADIYGPSVPKLSGLPATKPDLDKNKKLIPPVAHGIKVMSMGFLVEEEKAMIWRGPMVQSAFYQMLRDVAWGNEKKDLDVLIIDMPPGTGDVQLTLAQKVPVSGAVIVSTPQDLALIDARKAIAMFEKTNVKILGLIENMSYYTCPSCGHQDPVFGHGGAREESQKRGVPFLGEIPLNTQIRAESDMGMPSSLGVYQEIATRLQNQFL
jgi:ATP-binding protein involved in chromosome partitioning